MYNSLFISYHWSSFCAFTYQTASYCSKDMYYIPSACRFICDKQFIVPAFCKFLMWIICDMLYIHIYYWEAVCYLPSVSAATGGTFYQQVLQVLPPAVSDVRCCPCVSACVENICGSAEAVCQENDTFSQD